MFSKTRIAVILCVGLVLGVVGFVFVPALFPRADPAEEIAGESADSEVRAQGSTPSAEEAAGTCNATFVGIIMQRFDDGSVLFRFGDGHRVRVAPPSDQARRNAVLTYKDGTARVQDFEPGIKTEEMPYSDPLDDGWYDVQGKPRGEPSQGEYPELWPAIAKEFFPSADVDGHPWGDRWEILEPPGFNPQDAGIFGPVRRVIVEDDGETVWTWFADGTVKEARRYVVIYRNRGRVIVRHIYQGTVLYTYLGEDEGRPQVCPGQGEEVKEDVLRRVTIRYPDGVVRRFFVPAGTDEKNLSTADRYCDHWDLDGRPIEPLGPETHPILDLPPEFTGSPPPELFD